jgi:hypothetical protein
MEFLHLSASLNQCSSPLPAADCTIGALEWNSLVQRQMTSPNAAITITRAACVCLVFIVCDLLALSTGLYAGLFTLYTLLQT